MGTPCITTPIGSEGMMIDEVTGNWGGIIASDVNDIIKSSIQLYQHAELWKRCQHNGFRVITELFDEKKNSLLMINKLQEIVKRTQQLRQSNFIGEMLWYHGNRSTEYFSRWIEIKQQKADKS